MRVGFIQFKPSLGNLSGTVQSLDRLIDSASSADLVVLPELCNSGYNFPDFTMAFESSESIGKSTFVEFLISKASRQDLYIVSGFNERDGNVLYNSAILVGPKGYIGKYRKLHLFMHEKDFFEPGNVGLPVFDLGVCRIGMLVCFDWVFPEVWRILALQGADIICHPSNLVLPGLAQRAVPIHALINRTCVITANRIGQERNLTFTGMSTVVDPRGEILLQASQNEEEVGIVQVDVELARDKNITARNHLFDDRRPEQYAMLTKPKNGS